MERLGKSLAPLDLLIATHALNTDSRLVTSDRAFSQLPGLHLEDPTSKLIPRILLENLQTLPFVVTFTDG